MDTDFTPRMARRSYNRYIVDSAATLVNKNGLGINMILKDISARGIGAISDKFLKVGKAINITINGSFLKDPVAKKAKVVWVRSLEGKMYHLGLDFGLDNLIDLAR